MTPYGKVAQAAISATSLLAQNYAADGARRLNSQEIATERKLSRAIVAKVLTTLAQVGVVAGAPGPGGGYWLAKPPHEITLSAVVGPFERTMENLSCPFGRNWCGTGPQCPLHEQLERLRFQVDHFLSTTTLDKFRRS